MTLGQALRLESERASQERTPRVMPLDDASRITALELQVFALREELADLRRQTLGFRWANSRDSEDRATYQAGVE